MDQSIVLGADIGGSHITVARINTDKGIMVKDSFNRISVNAAGEKEEILTAWCSAIQGALKGTQAWPVKLGIAMPGPFDYENGICLIKEQEKYRSLYGVDVKKEIASRLNIDPAEIRFINDACGFLLGEMLAGGMIKDSKRVMGITLGTGLGSAVGSGYTVEDADLWRDPFKSGIAEDFLSTRWFLKEYEACCGKKINGVKEIVQQLDTNETAKNIFALFAENLTSFIAGVFDRQPVETIIIGGNIAKASGHFLEDVRTGLLHRHIVAEIKIAKLGETAAMIGAAGMFAGEAEKLSA